jgi:hypothetical protein
MEDFVRLFGSLLAFENYSALPKRECSKGLDVANRT